MSLRPVYVLEKQETFVKRFRIKGTKIVFKFTNPPIQVNEIDWLKQGFEQVIQELKENVNDTDQIGFTLRSLNLKTTEPGYIAFRPASEFTDDSLWSVFGGLIQSNSEAIKSTDTFQVDCTVVNLPVGAWGTSMGHRL